MGKRGHVILHTQTGRRIHPCTILSETAKKFRVKFDKLTILPTRVVKAGQPTLVPKSFVIVAEKEG